MAKIKVLHVVAGKEPTLVTVENELEELQKLVGGYLEVVTVGKDLVMIGNEEAQLDDLVENFSLVDLRNNQSFTIYGNVFFASTLGEVFYTLDKMQTATARDIVSLGRKVLQEMKGEYINE